MAEQQQPMRVFYSYSHKDATLRDELETHLAALKRSGVIQGWSDRDITGGQEWAGQIDKNLESADIILLLISADFINSDYCYDKEMGRALERHAAGTARIIPVIVRPVDWETTPFHKLQALPAGAKAVTTWPNRDEAWVDVVRGIRKAIQSFMQERLARREAVRLEELFHPKDVTNDPAYANAVPAELARIPGTRKIFVFKRQTIVLSFSWAKTLQKVFYNGKEVPFSVDYDRPSWSNYRDYPNLLGAFKIMENGHPTWYIVVSSGDERTIKLFEDIQRQIFP